MRCIVHELEVNSDRPFLRDGIDHGIDADVLLVDSGLRTRDGARRWHQSGVADFILGHRELLPFVGLFPFFIIGAISWAFRVLVLRGNRWP